MFLELTRRNGKKFIVNIEQIARVAPLAFDGEGESEVFMAGADDHRDSIIVTETYQMFKDVMNKDPSIEALLGDFASNYRSK